MCSQNESTFQVMISVIIPLYNKGRKVCTTIDSVLNQSYADFEIIVVDDGSTDDSGAYVKQYADERVHYFHKGNGGVSSARNYGIAVSKGEWVMFLDADDEIVPSAFSELMALHDKYAECKYLVGQTLWIRNGKELSSGRNRKFSAPFCTKHPFWEIWKNTCYPVTQNMIVHRTLLDEYGGYDERMSFFEDYEFSLRMAKCGSMACSNKTIGIYNQDDSGLSQTSHSLDAEMAYYFPELIKKASFLERSLYFENLEFMLYYVRDDKAKYEFYKNMRNHLFGRIYRVLHLIRHKFFVN